MTNIYDDFESNAIDLYEREIERVSLKFDPERDYPMDELMDAMGQYAGNEIEKTGQRYLKLVELLPKNISAEPTQAEINRMYEIVQRQIHKEVGKKPYFAHEEIAELAEQARKLDSFITDYLDQSFGFYKPIYGNRSYTDNSDASLNLLVNDSYLKFECFFATSLASLAHMLRQVCDINQGFIARIILARSMFEIALHQLFIVRRVRSLTERTKNLSKEKCFDEFLAIKNIFSRGMWGTKSPFCPSQDNRVDPYNILTCFDCLKRPAGELNREYAENYYAHLCDFAHPNLGMRSLLFDLRPMPGDYFSTEIDIDRSLTCRQHVASQNDMILHAVEITYVLIETALEEKEIVRENMNDRNLKIFDGKIRFNKITNQKRPTLSAT